MRSHHGMHTTSLIRTPPIDVIVRTRLAAMNRSARIQAILSACSAGRRPCTRLAATEQGLALAWSGATLGAVRRASSNSRMRDNAGGVSRRSCPRSPVLQR